MIKAGFILIVVWYAEVDPRIMAMEIPRFPTSQTCLDAADILRDWLAKRGIWPAYVYTRCIKEAAE